MKRGFLTAWTFWICAFTSVWAESWGTQLWLDRSSSASTKEGKVLLLSKRSATTDIAISEIRKTWNGGEIVLERCAKGSLENDAFRIDIKDGKVTINAPSDCGLLYATYHLLRLEKTRGTNAYCDTSLTERPQHDLRLLNHWDNLDGTVERGYAGRSIFPISGSWAKLSDNDVREHLITYCRANASIGVNGAVINNVNASPQVLNANILKRVKEYADIMRPYGIRVYLAVNFASPMALDGFTTADPLNKDVQRWWKDKAKEIYQLIPDFGGFLVKANSEGQPGPMDYGRTHAQGANMLAKALKPYGGIVMWRAFVYSPSDADRAKQAYIEFKGLDGRFMDNVIIQIKNGPIDFQPREPYSPLFGAMPKTQQMAELQITQEYLGHSNHICFLSTMWEEFLNDVKGYAHYTENMKGYKHRAIAGVANVGSNPNFCGNVMAQANWYAFGRLAWNSDITSEQIAKEWTAQMAGADSNAAKVMTDIMMGSRETVVEYMMPLGLHHIFAEGHHYGPQPWQNNPGQRADWQCVYYHRADSLGIGFDRTQRTGSGATAQYPASFAGMVEDIHTCPEKYLLWFHHVAWDHKCRSGRTLWDELCWKYQHGLDGARGMLRNWNTLEGSVPQDVFMDIQQRMQIQVRDAEWWKDACLLYFQTFSRQPLPVFVDPPVHSLDELKAVRLGISNYECPTRNRLRETRF